MTERGRGRPPGPTELRRRMLKNPPRHIKERVTARGGVIPEHWAEVMNSMEEHRVLVEIFRRRLMASAEVATGLLSPYAYGMTDDVLGSLRMRLPDPRRLGRMGGLERARARARALPSWKEYAAIEIKKYAGHSASRAAELILDKLSGPKDQIRSHRTLRGFIGAVRKKLAA